MRPGSIDDTRRVPVVDYAPTRVFRQVRQPRTPVRLPAVVVLDPDVRSGQLAHPRLVRRARPAPSPRPRTPEARRASSCSVTPRPVSRDFDDEPTTSRG